jgi:hypothetical protein
MCYELDVQVVRVQFLAGAVTLLSSPQYPELLLIHFCPIHLVSQMGKRQERWLSAIERIKKGVGQVRVQYIVFRKYLQITA